MRARGRRDADPRGEPSFGVPACPPLSAPDDAVRRERNDERAEPGLNVDQAVIETSQGTALASIANNTDALTRRYADWSVPPWHGPPPHGAVITGSWARPPTPRSA